MPLKFPSKVPKVCGMCDYRKVVARGCDVAITGTGGESKQATDFVLRVGVVFPMQLIWTVSESLTSLAVLDASDVGNVGLSFALNSCSSTPKWSSAPPPPGYGGRFLVLTGQAVESNGEGWSILRTGRIATFKS